MANITLVNDQRLFFTAIGIILILAGYSITNNFRSQNKEDLGTGTFLTALGLFFFARALSLQGRCAKKAGNKVTNVKGILGFIGAALVFFGGWMLLSSREGTNGIIEPNVDQWNEGLESPFQISKNGGGLLRSKWLGFLVFALGWILISIAAMSSTPNLKKWSKKNIISSILGLTLLLSGALVVQEQEKSHKVDAPGQILEALGLIAMAIAISNDANESSICNEK